MIGKIHEISCTNFVTYNDFQFFPSDQLNVIIGPNGTGKSTIISAILLCLGGDPKILSRATSVQHYIQNGFSSSTIRVDIHKNHLNELISFERRFDQTGKSVYKIDRRVVSKTDYIKTVWKYNIQINNLCQFLPQDRVQDFAKMNPQDLLSNTISSVCSQDVIEKFTKLKELQKSQETKNKTISEINEQISVASSKMKELEKLLETDMERKLIEKKYKICVAKKKWLEYQSAQKKMEDNEKNMKVVEIELKKKKKAHQTILKNQQPIQQTQLELENEYKKQVALQKKFNENSKNSDKQIEDEMKNILDEILKEEQREKHLSERKIEIHNQSQLLEVLKQDVQNAKDDIGSESKLKAEKDKIEDEILDLNQNMTKLMKQRQEITRRIDEECSVELEILNNRIKRFQNYKDQKLKFLKEKFPDVYTALEWLRKNLNLFSGKIYEPLMLEINIPDTKNVMYIENSIPLRDLTSFACENESDVLIFTNEVCIKQKLRVSIGHAPKNSGVIYTPKIPTDKLKEIGFSNYIVDLIEAPKPILDYFCSLYNIHQVPVGNDKLQEDNVPPSLQLFFKDDTKFNIIISKYSGETSIMTSRVFNKMILTSVNPEEVKSLTERLKIVQKLRDELRNNRTTIEAEFNEVNFKRKELLTNKRLLESKSNRIKGLCLNLELQQKKVEDLNKNLQSDLIDNKIDIKMKLEKSFEYLIDGLFTKKIDAFDLYLNSTNDRMYKEARIRVFKKDTQKIQFELEESIRDLKEIEERYNKMSKDLENIKNSCKLKLNAAKNLTDNRHPDDSKFKYKNEFKNLSNDIEEISKLIAEHQACLECMDVINPDVQIEYDEKCKELESLNNILKECLDKVSENTTNTKELFEIWYPQIDVIIKDINVNFGKYMENMDYVGEVVLTRKDEYDFDSYGILLYVQYRKNVKLQPLDRNVQSGGERAVAIATYSLSLQHLTNVPFRCVDEINQGMDSRNERKLFEMLLVETTQNSQSQYFFVTPKLLPNINTNRKQTFSIIYNGKMF